METETWRNHLLLNICIFLPLKDVLMSLALTSKPISQKIKAIESILIREFISNGAKLLRHSSLPVLRSLLASPSLLLKFKPLYYNGGVSNIDIQSSFETLWEYSGTVYSTFYKKEHGKLDRNRLCAAYFAGVEGENLMRRRFHYDLTLMAILHQHIAPFIRKILIEHRETALTFDYLAKEVNWEIPSEVIMDNETWDRHIYENSKDRDAGPMEKCFPYEPEASSVCIVKEVAVARPLNFTGAVKTMLLLAGTQETSEYRPEMFRKWEDIDTLEKASNLSVSLSKGRIEGVDYVEFAPSADPYYPLLWLHFPSLDYNHIRVRLARPQAIRQVTAMLYTTEDKRQEYSLEGVQPNFDLMFIIFLGTIEEKETEEEERT